MPQGAENAESSILSAVFCPGNGTHHFCCLLIDQNKPRGPTLPAGSPEVQFSPPTQSLGSLTALENSTSAPHTFRVNIWKLISLLSSERASGSFFHFHLDSLSFLFLRTLRDKKNKAYHIVPRRHFIVQPAILFNLIFLVFLLLFLGFLMCYVPFQL